MRLLICGGRDFRDHSLMDYVLEGIRDTYFAQAYFDDGLFNKYYNYRDDHFYMPRARVVISGTARGADQLGELWAKRHNIPIDRYPAEWSKYGKRAGYLRNIRMADEGKPDLIIAFPGGRGTEMMIDIAAKRHIDYLVINSQEAAAINDYRS